MKEEWLLNGAVVPVDVETTSALVAEIHRLIGVVGGMALAQPEQKPVAYIQVSKTGNVMACAKTRDFYSLPHNTLLYTTPPQRTWVGLTVDELIDLEQKHVGHENLARAIEAKLKEKNT